MWIFLWIILSLFVLGIFGWQSWILWEQKKAWKAFARKNGMEYEPRRSLDSAIVRGTIGGFRMTLFSDSKQTNDIRRERYVSVIEFELGDGMPTGAAIGTSDMKPFIDTLSFTQNLTPDYEKWTGGYVARTRDREALRLYLTQPRLDALVGLFGMNNASVLYFFDELDCVLHIETIDPLRDPEKLDRIINRIVRAVNVLAIPNMSRKDERSPVPPGEASSPVPDAGQDSEGGQV